MQLLIVQTRRVEQDEFEHYRSSLALEEPSVFNLEMCLASQGFVYSLFCPDIIVSHLSFALSLSLITVIY